MGHGWIQDISKTVLQMQAAAWLPWLVGAVIVALIALAQTRVARGVAISLSAAALVSALVVGLWWAWAGKWLCDDAYISFTYAKRFAEGFGFVLNPGERVEGYTNFLWVLLLGLLSKAGGSIPEAGLFLDLAFFIVAVLAASFLAASPQPGPHRWALPLAGMAVALSRPFYTFATSGLETLPALALAALAVLQWQRAKRGQAAVLFAIAAMTRPDHLLLAGAAWVTEAIVLLAGRTPVRIVVGRVLRFAAPTLVLFGAYWIWRWGYYGDFLPNTFYAKSGGGSYFSQGVVYLTHGLLASGAWLALALLAILAPWALRSPAKRPLVLYACAVALTHGLYVVKVGGDFMEFRFLLPSLFFALVASDVALRPVLLEGFAKAGWRTVAALVVCAAFGLLATNVRPITDAKKRWYLSAEDTFYRVTSIFPFVLDHPFANSGRQLKEALQPAGLAPRFAFGCIGMVAYYSEMPLIDTYGLATKSIARKPLTRRGRPGHEKRASTADLLDEMADLSERSPWPEWDHFTPVQVGGVRLHLLHHLPRLEALARSKGWHYPDIDAEISGVIMHGDLGQVRKSRDFFARFLEDTPNAGERLARFDRVLSGAWRQLPPDSVPDDEWPTYLRRAEFLGERALATRLARRIVRRVTFDETAADIGLQGNLLPPAAGKLPRQSPVSGFHGRLLVNTFGAEAPVTGAIALNLQAGAGLRLNLLVGGGDDCALTAVVLYSGEREVERWCGAKTNVLRPVSRDLDDVENGKLAILDTSSARRWSHILADDILVFRRAPTAADAAPQTSPP